MIAYISLPHLYFQYITFFTHLSLLALLLYTSIFYILNTIHLPYSLKILSSLQLQTYFIHTFILFILFFIFTLQTLHINTYKRTISIISWGLLLSISYYSMTLISARHCTRFYGYSFFYAFLYFLFINSLKFLSSLQLQTYNYPVNTLPR